MPKIRAVDAVSILTNAAGIDGTGRILPIFSLFKRTPHATRTLLLFQTLKAQVIAECALPIAAPIA
jgi:hypothetical protein